MALTSLKRQSLPSSSQSLRIERSESEIVGTHRTCRIVRRCDIPISSLATIGRSPMSVQAWSRRSTPEMVSSVGRALMR